MNTSTAFILLVIQAVSLAFIVWYSYTLLLFIKADQALWNLWIMMMVMTIVTTLVSTVVKKE